MRIAINLLQAASSSGKVVTDVTVFAISGRADPEKIRTLLSTATAGNFDGALGILKALIFQDGVAPLDLTRQIHRELYGLDISTSRKQSTLERTAEVEFRVAEGADGEVQLAALLAHIALGQDN